MNLNTVVIGNCGDLLNGLPNFRDSRCSSSGHKGDRNISYTESNMEVLAVSFGCR